MMRSKRASSFKVPSSTPARDGSTKTVEKPYSAKSICCSCRRRNSRLPLNASVNSSADSLAMRMLSALFAAMFYCAACTEVLETSVAKTRRKRRESGRVKLPLPQ